MKPANYQGRWVDICPVDLLCPDRGVAALVGGDQVAIFRTSPWGQDGAALYAVSNRDPFSGANVIARGIIGSAGEVTYVASPMFKQRFDLSNGACLDDATLSLATWPVRARGGRVQVQVQAKAGAEQAA